MTALASVVERSEALNRNLQNRLADVSSGRAGGVDRVLRDGRREDLPQGWQRGKLPGLGSCGGMGGNLRKVWDCWGGAGPAAALGTCGGATGLNLRSHGDVTIKQQEAWCSTSTFSRYVLSGRFMDKRVAAIKVRSLGLPNRDRFVEFIALE